jgi:YidC/Oxa1 family membrane protein insertase
MSTEVRFLLAIGLMLVVLVGTNLLFPPDVPVEAPAADTTTAALERGAAPPAAAPEIPEAAVPGPDSVGQPWAEAAPEELVAVEGPLYRYTFSSHGARLVSAQMLQFQALNREGLVDLIPEGAGGYLGQRLLVGSDTVDMRQVPFRVDPGAGVTLHDGDGPRSLRFTYQHPTRPFGMELEYRFLPDEYQVLVRGRVTGVERPLVITDMGEGLAYSEADSAGEARAMAYVGNHVRDGILSTPLSRAVPGVQEGPLKWAAFRSKFFVLALLAGESEASTGEERLLGGLILSRGDLQHRVRAAATQTVAADGSFAFRLFMGPQEYTRPSTLGEDMEEVNPYGWKFFRPIVRPFVSAITWILVFFHTQLSLGYGWVLILFGVLMRVVLWPLNQKAMRAQLKNMAVQPLMQEIQSKYKDNPEKLQKEMMRLYKEEGFNPFGGCLPLLLPWPILIALFFVFQNRLELRGTSLLWLPDLSRQDP